LAGAAGLTELVAPTLDARLETSASRPFVVAFSGGGDSLALLLAAKQWADHVGRRVIALTVDHGLQPAGADWARACAERAARLGVAHQTLLWEGRKPTSGIPAAARKARHALLADVARERGARVILMGHTADDRLEARAMRLAGSIVGEPSEWGPSPAWPQGRDVFILRPMLAVRRANLRERLRALGEIWIEDPANVDFRFARARARASLNIETSFDPSDPRPNCAGLFEKARVGADGEVRIGRRDLAAAPPRQARAFLGAALLCSAGTARPPRGRSLDLMMARIAADASFTATLAGARVEAVGGAICFCREPGRRPRQPGSPDGSMLASEPSHSAAVVRARLAAACGMVGDEAAIGRVAKWLATP
jgi:tRNA(Ile)-lysidine synthase